MSLAKFKSKNLTGKYTQNFLDHPKQSPTDTLKSVSKSAIQKIVETIGDLIGNDIAGKTTSIASQINPEIASQANEKPIEIPKERYISLVKKTANY